VSPRWKRWNDDLESVAAGTLSFDCLVRAHRGLIRRVAAPWVAHGEIEDIEQELLIELWNTINSWDPTRGKLSFYVGRWWQYKLLKVKRSSHTRFHGELRFVERAPVLDVVVGNNRVDSSHHQSPESVRLISGDDVGRSYDVDERIDASRAYHRALGKISASHAATVTRYAAGKVDGSVRSERRRRKQAVDAFVAAARGE